MKAQAHRHGLTQAASWGTTRFAAGPRLSEHTHLKGLARAALALHDAASILKECLCVQRAVQTKAGSGVSKGCVTTPVLLSAGACPDGYMLVLALLDKRVRMQRR